MFLHQIASTAPTMKYLIKFVCGDHAADWKRIGYLLGMSQGALDAIEKNYPANNKWCCDRMFEEWLQNDPNATWGKVFDAIDSPLIHNRSLTGITVTQGRYSSYIAKKFIGNF